MGPQLHETPYGRMFFQSLLPNLIKAINRLADAIEKQNVLKGEEWLMRVGIYQLIIELAPSMLYSLDNDMPNIIYVLL